MKETAERNIKGVDTKSDGSGSSVVSPEVFGDDVVNTSHTDSFDTSTSHQNNMAAQAKDIEQTTKRTFFVAILVLVIGAVASASFLWLGITNENESQKTLFLGRATDLAGAIDASWQDYETAALWIHESCHLVSS